MDRREKGIIRLVNRNIAGARNIMEAWEYLQDFDWIMLQETWIERKNIKDTINRLDGRCEWWIKEAVWEEAKKKAKGEQVIGLRKENEIFEIKEWEFGGIIKEERLKIIIITVYNNKKMEKLKESLDEIMEEKLKAERNLIIVGDWNARIGVERARTEISKNEEWRRKSEDKTLNNEGRKMSELCEEYGLTVMNGVE